MLVPEFSSFQRHLERSKHRNKCFNVSRFIESPIYQGPRADRFDRYS